MFLFPKRREKKKKNEGGGAGMEEMKVRREGREENKGNCMKYILYSWILNVL